MSLDVYLSVEKPKDEQVKLPPLYVKVDDEFVEMTIQDYFAEYAPQFWIELPEAFDVIEEVYWANITHNLTKMASEAGLYDALWHPENLNISKAGDLIQPMEAGLATLKANKEHFKQFNAKNGWGNVSNLISFTAKYLAACKEYPNAIVETSV